jgi:tRNA(fMet)-specific endonuclease VapC
LIYCLDTDIIIEYFRGTEAIKNKIENLGDNDSVGLTWLSVYEFFKGIFASGKFDEEMFLKKLVESAVMLEESYESTKIGGDIYGILKRNGNLLNDADIIIASIVKSRDSVLVTNNEEHFRRINGLKVENWLKT